MITVKICLRELRIVFELFEFQIGQNFYKNDKAQVGFLIKKKVYKSILQHNRKSK